VVLGQLTHGKKVNATRVGKQTMMNTIDNKERKHDGILATLPHRLLTMTTILTMKEKTWKTLMTSD
jgi:hypothetical protein